MRNAIFHLLFIFICTSQVFSQEANDAIEPAVNDQGTIDLLEGLKLDAWKVPSDKWYIDGESIVASTGEEKLKTPEWLYTKQRFGDFEFTCELKLTGDSQRNTGIYYRAKIILFKGHQNNSEGANNNWKPYEAPSGYELDAAFHKPGKKNFWGSLGDYYTRPSLRIYPDQAIINQVYEPEKWNRMTIRARGNRLEYWINGFKVIDYLDNDPKASREGMIGLQIHDGSVMKVEYRNLRVLPLTQ